MALCLLTLWPPLAGADAVTELSTALSRIETYRADFRQVIYDQHGKRIQESTGLLYAARPGRLRWVAREPYEQLIVVDGEQIWRYEEDLEQVIVSDYDADLGQTPALLLSGDVASIASSYTVVRTSSYFTLLPKDEASLFRAMEVTLKEGRLTRIQLKDSLGQTTVLSFSGVELNPSLDASLFQFEPPAGVDVLRDE